MRPRISVKGCVCPSVRPSVRRSRFRRKREKSMIWIANNDVSCNLIIIQSYNHFIIIEDASLALWALFHLPMEWWGKGITIFFTYPWNDEARAFLTIFFTYEEWWGKGIAIFFTYPWNDEARYRWLSFPLTLGMVRIDPLLVKNILEGIFFSKVQRRLKVVVFAP